MAPKSFLDLPTVVRYRCYWFSLEGVEAHLHQRGYSLVFKDEIGRFDHSLLQACRQTRLEMLTLTATIPLQLHCGFEHAKSVLTMEYSIAVETIVIDQDRARSSATRALTYFPKLKEIIVNLDPEHIAAYRMDPHDSPGSAGATSCVKRLARSSFASMRRLVSYDGTSTINFSFQKRYDVEARPFRRVLARVSDTSNGKGVIQVDLIKKVINEEDGDEDDESVLESDDER